MGSFQSLFDASTAIPFLSAYHNGMEMAGIVKQRENILTLQRKFIHLTVGIYSLYCLLFSFFFLVHLSFFLFDIWL